VAIQSHTHILPRVCSVDAHGVDPVQQKLEGLAHDPGAVDDLSRQHAGAHLQPLVLRFAVAPRRLHATDDADHTADEALAGHPVVGSELHLVLDEVDVDDLGDSSRLGLAGEVADPVANLGKHAEHARVAGREKLKVVGQAVPERLRTDDLSGQKALCKMRALKQT
jgi:hypothetical protein